MKCGTILKRSDTTVCGKGRRTCARSAASEVLWQGSVHTFLKARAILDVSDNKKMMSALLLAVASLPQNRTVVVSGHTEVYVENRLRSMLYPGVVLDKPRHSTQSVGGLPRHDLQRPHRLYTSLRPSPVEHLPFVEPVSLVVLHSHERPDGLYTSSLHGRRPRCLDGRLHCSFMERKTSDRLRVVILGSSSVQ